MPQIVRTTPDTDESATAIRQIIAGTLHPGGVTFAPGGGGSITISASSTGAAEPEQPTEPGEPLFTRQALGTGAPAGTVYTFAQPFARGRVPALRRVVCRRARGGAALATQFEPQTYWPDGSVKFALMAIELPLIAARAVENIGFHVAPLGGLVAELDLVAALRGRSASVTISPTSGPAWTCDLIAHLPAHPKERRRSGPLVAEARVAVPIPSASFSGSTAGRLVCDLWVTRDGGLFLTPWPGNHAVDWPEPTAVDATVSMTVEIDGQKVATRSGVIAAGAGPVRFLVGRRAGAAADPNPIFLRPANREMMNAGLCGWYPPDFGVAPARLSRLGQLRKGDTWNDWTTGGTRKPLRNLIHGGPTGNNENLYCIPFGDGSAAWMLGGDPEFFLYAVEQAEGMGAAGMYPWDKANNRWLNQRDRRSFRAHGTNSKFRPAPQSGNTFMDDRAHHPMVQELPYLLTGRHDLLDGMLAYAHLESMDGYFRDAQGRFIWSGGDRQVRTMGYTAACMAIAHFVTPDAEPDVSPGWLLESLESNFKWHIGRIPAENATYGEIAGALRSSNGTITPWQMALVISAVALAKKQGVEGAGALLAWMQHHMVQAWLQIGPDWPLNAVAYSQPTTSADGRVMITWAEFIRRQAETLPAQKPNQKDANYVRLARMMLAIQASVEPENEAVKAALRAHAAVGFHGLTTADLQANPRQAVSIPPGSTGPNRRSG